MSLDGPSYYGWMPGPTSTTALNPNIPIPKEEGKKSEDDDITPPSSPPLTPQSLRSFSDFDMPGGWRKSFGAAAAPPQFGPQRTNNHHRHHPAAAAAAGQRREHVAPYNKDPSAGNTPPRRTGGSTTPTPLQAEETLLADDLNKPSRPGLNQPAYKRQNANQRPCRSGSFTGGNHIPPPTPPLNAPRQTPGPTISTAEAHAQTRAFVQANFGFTPGLGRNNYRQSAKTFWPSFPNAHQTTGAKGNNSQFNKEQAQRMMEEVPDTDTAPSMKRKRNAPPTPPPESPHGRPPSHDVPINPFAHPVPSRYATPSPAPATNFMPTPPSSHPSSDNEFSNDGEDENDMTEKDLRLRAALAANRSHRAAASVRKARADLARYIEQREADMQLAKERRRRDAERKRRNDFKSLREKQAAWWNSRGGSSSSSSSSSQQHQQQQPAPNPSTPAAIQRQLREMEERERLRQALLEEKARKANELRKLRRQEEEEEEARRQQWIAHQEQQERQRQMLAEQARQEQLRREAEEQAAAFREAERLRLLREQEERERLWREQEEERMRQQAALEEEQRHVYEEQQRRIREEQERERQQRQYTEANWRGILEEQCRLAMDKMRTDAAYLAECREAYESTWAELSRPAPSSGCPQFINIVYFPWPCSITFALDVCHVETLPFIITAESVGEFLTRGVSDLSEVKRRLRKASARFHPDKLARICPRLREEDREFIKAGFEMVQIQLNLLMEQYRQQM